MLFHSTWMRILIICAAVMVCYSFMVSAPFKVLDDAHSIVENQTIHDPHAMGRIFTSGYFQDHSYYRPLTNLSYWAEYQWVGPQPFVYNLDNLILHAINAVLVFIFISFVTGNSTIGFWTGLLFAIHPVQWESVSNISGRAILLSTFFSLVSLIGGWVVINYQRTLGWFIVSIVAFLGALLSKESGAAVMVIVLGLCWMKRSCRPWAMIIPYLIMFSGYLAIRRYLGITETFLTDRLDLWLLGIISFFYALVDLLRLYVLPLGLHFDRSAEYIVNYVDWRIFAAVIGWIVAIGLLLRYRNKFSKASWLAIGIMVISLLPVAQIVTSIGVQPGRISIAEHFLYFASIGACLLMVKGWLWIYKKERISKSLLKILTALGIVFGCLLTIEQNMYASNEFAMLKRSLAINPSNARLQSSLGMIYALNHNYEKAEEHFGMAVRLDPANARYRISLGRSLCDQGRIDEGLAIYNTVNNPGGFEGLLEQNRREALQLKHAIVHP